MERTRGDQYQGNLKVGQVVHCILYGGKDGVISAIHGTQDPASIKSLGGGCVVMGGRATIDVAFPEYVSRGIPEGIVRGVQWYISNTIETKEVIDSCLEIANEAVDQEKEKQRKEGEEKTNIKVGLPAKYPYLTPKNNGISSHALGAKNLRIELKRAFPRIKFSVRSESYSGGDSINVGWTDGPLTEDVEKISNKYQEGSFDGMIDLYEYDHSNVWPDVFGGAKYVFENRHESTELLAKVAKDWGYIGSMEIDNMGLLPGLDHETSQMIYREARKTRA